jgi:predicted peptidase
VRLRAAILPLLALLATACASQSRFLERSVDVNGHRYGYRIWLPPRYNKLHHWPVVLYLHGSAERGDDNLRQISVGLATALEQFPDRYKSIVVFPQARFGQEWYGEMEQQALAALDATIREFHGDPRRVYLTGVSMGGAGAWYTARHKRRFAAIVPIAGEVVRQPDDPFPTDPPPDIARIVGSPDPYLALATAIGRTPVWVFHGTGDDKIPVTESRNMVAALKRVGGRVKYTELPDEGHEIWDSVYADPELVKWLFAQRTGR